jgi:hypothetical protein
MAWVVKDSKNVVYTFQLPDDAKVAGTFESGSRNYDWNIPGHDDRIAQNWKSIAANHYAVGQASVTLDVPNLVNSIIQALGLVLAIISVV